jgi:5-methylcytosine-specific restriction protein A
MLQHSLQRVLSEYPQARLEPLERHPLASFIRGALAAAIRSTLQTSFGELTVEGSHGKGNWADVPWVGIFDPIVTETARQGYYVVYLFSADGTEVHLSLNQGATSVRAEFKSKAPEVLMQRAAMMRRRLASFADDLPVTQIRLGSDGRNPRDYEAGHAIGRTYKSGAIPDDAALSADLLLITRAYLSLTFRGGLDPSNEIGNDPDDDLHRGASITEVRRYRMHRRIERNPRASDKVKRVHGTTCQACRHNFGKSYGSLGEGYIEAHHLRPLSELNEGESASYDPERDFAVLCANCHRMIHRMDDPSDLDGLIRLVRSTIREP